MRYLSLFSGIEAVTVAWKPIEWKPAAFAEIGPFACAVLQHHYPDVPNLGDVTKITDAQIAALGHIDLVVGGSPCQDLSCAGKRAGLAGERSGLFFELIRIFYAARAFCGARFLLWENVPGTLSSNQGRDFGSVVAAMAGNEFTCTGWGWEGAAVGDQGLVEWAILDAQWFGLAQRRKRLFALLDTGNWKDRQPILLEPDGLRGNSPPSRRAQENAAPALDTRAGRIGANAEGSDGVTLTASNCAKGVNNQTPIVFCGDVSPTSYTLTSGNCSHIQNRTPLVVHGTQDPCVSSAAFALGRNGGLENIVCEHYSVRRFTPVECERLQGFPDNYTAVSCRGKPAADTPRYRALGDSMAVPVMRWIGEKIDAAVLKTN
jgi:DNA (cytosine-5)-methyltransferase 1